MSTHTFKNHLGAARTHFGLSQRQLAVILGMRSAARVCAMERGRAIPTVKDCVTFQLLFGRSFEELWPRFHFETQASADLNIRRLVGRLERCRIRTARQRAKTRIVADKLAKVVNELPEESHHAL